ncbi:MAG: amidohydrolase family protein, partial [Phycisphaerales bacterium]|nr:amidohydrolase family protein [Phycisphaerales bacterium]
MANPELISVSRGDSPADLILSGARVVNVFNGQIEEGNIAIVGDRIAGIGPYTLACRTIDLGGAFVAPGFIDAHMHVESTFLPPSQFVRLAAPHGTTGAVFDPHEIANVLGLDGIRFLMDDAVGLPIHAMFALSSCVPASHLEHSGARLEADDLAPLFNDPRVVALAEVMNFPGVVAADPGLLAKVRLGLTSHVVDGHAPGLRGKRLQAYVAAGITSDHECTTADEALEKIGLGMRIFIREGSAARNLEALLSAVTAETAHRFCFCTDDRHPADLAHEGHIDHIVRKAI